MYMSYCRFEGTLHELRACMGEVDEHVDGYAEYPVSDREIMHFSHMMEELADWMRDLGIIDEDGCIDRNGLDRICEAMKRGADE